VEGVRADRGVSRGDGRDDFVDLDVKRFSDGTLGPDTYPSTLSMRRRKTYPLASLQHPL
jgi:hypothetical protein